MSEHHTLNAILGKAKDLSIKRKHSFWHSPFVCEKEKNASGTSATNMGRLPHAMLTTMKWQATASNEKPDQTEFEHKESVSGFHAACSRDS